MSCLCDENQSASEARCPIHGDFAQMQKASIREILRIVIHRLELVLVELKTSLTQLETETRLMYQQPDHTPAEPSDSEMLDWLLDEMRSRGDDLYSRETVRAAIAEEKS